VAFPVASTKAPTGSTAPTLAYANRFIPLIWSGKLLDKFYDSTILAAISNTDYEGEIQKFGDTVRIRTRATITINDYQADGALVYERPSSDTIDFLIDKGKYWGAVLDDVIKTQSDMNLMDMWADDAAEQLKITIYTSNLLPSAAETVPTAATAYHCFGGHTHALTFASQLTELETLRVESTFGTVMRGLQVYGHKVIDGTFLVDAYIVKG
jgi:hypothetical protein